MKRLIPIFLVTLIALMFSGCVIVDAHYSHRHGYHDGYGGGIIVTNYPPPPPPRYIFRPVPPPSVVIVGPALPPSGPPRPHYGNPGPQPRPEGRRDLRR